MLLTQDADIEHITLSLVTRMEVESGGGDYAATGEFTPLDVYDDDDDDDDDEDTLEDEDDLEPID